MEFIKLKNIGKIYSQDHTATVGIQKVNLSFQKGEFVAVTGASGSGKSTLLNVISGMDTFEEGELYIEGEPTSHFNGEDWEIYRNKYISVVFQNYSIIESMTVLENVELALLHIRAREDRMRKALRLITRVGLENEKNQKAGVLSGGQKQRVGIARALAKDTPILLADEPTGNLDSDNSNEIIKLLHSVSEEKLVIVVTHSFEEIEQYATRKIVVDDNRITDDQVLKAVPETSETALDADAYENQSGIVSKGIRIGKMLYCSMSGMTFFYTILILFVALVLTAFSGITGKRLKSNLLMDCHIFQPVSGRVIVVKSDKTDISREEVQSLAKTSSADSFLHCDCLYDVHSINEWNHFLQEPDMYADGKQDYPFWIVSDESFGMLSVGQYPQKPSECVLSIPYSLASIFGRDSIRIETIYQFGLELRVTGIYYYEDNNRMGQILVNKETYEILSLLAYYKQSLRSSIQIDTVEIDNSSLQNIKIRYSFNVAEDEIRIRIRDLLLLSDDQLTGMTAKLYITDSKEYSESAITTVKEYPDHVVFDKTLSKTEDLVLVNPRTIQKELSNRIEQTYGQCSLFYRDPAAKKQAIRDLNRNGYIAVSSEEKYYPTDSGLMSEILEGVLMIGILFAVTVIMILILVFSTGKVVGTCEKEIAIMQAFGIESAAIKISTVVRTILSCIPSWIGMALFGIFAYRIELINKMLLYLYWQHYLVIGLLILVVVLHNGQKRTGQTLSKPVTTKLWVLK